MAQDKAQHPEVVILVRQQQRRTEYACDRWRRHRLTDQHSRRGHVQFLCGGIQQGGIILPRHLSAPAAHRAAEAGVHHALPDKECRRTRRPEPEDRRRHGDIARWIATGICRELLIDRVAHLHGRLPVPLRYIAEKRVRGYDGRLVHADEDRVILRRCDLHGRVLRGEIDGQQQKHCQCQPQPAACFRAVALLPQRLGGEYRRDHQHAQKRGLPQIQQKLFHAALLYRSISSRNLRSSSISLCARGCSALSAATKLPRLPP